MLLFISTNAVNLINFAFSILILKSIDSTILSNVAIYIAIQLAIFLFFTGEQNLIASKIDNDDSSNASGLDKFSDRYYDYAFFAFALFLLGYLFMINPQAKIFLSQVLFIISIILSRNLMQFRGALLQSSMSVHYSISIVIENSAKFLIVALCAILLESVHSILVGLASAPVLAWALMRMKVSNPLFQKNNYALKFSGLFSIFLLIQLGFFVGFDLPYVFLNIIHGASPLASNLAFLGIFSKIIFFGSLSFSLILITKFSKLGDLQQNIRALNLSLFFVFSMALLGVLIVFLFSDSVIKIISQPSFLELTNVLWMSVISSAVFTMLYITLSAIASAQTADIKNIILSLFVLCIMSSALLVMNILSLKHFISLQIIVFGCYFLYSYFTLIKHAQKPKTCLVI